MGCFKLYVAFYRPLPGTGNYQHWALYLAAPDDAPEENTLIHVLEAHPTFKPSIETGASISARTFSPRIFLGETCLCEIQPGGVQQLRDIAKEAKVDNETLDWTCQDYVIEILEALEEACIIGFDGEDYDQEYAENKEKIMEKYGAMI
jgi:hypothetical protein